MSNNRIGIPKNHRIEVGNLDDETAKLLHQFLIEKEKLITNENSGIIYKKNTLYSINDYETLTFNVNLSAHRNDKGELIYTAMTGDKKVGEGTYGVVRPIVGKLKHSKNKMVYIKTKDQKTGYQVYLASIDLSGHTVNDFNTAALEKLARGKIPVLMKDKHSNEVYLWGRKKNVWQITRLEKDQFDDVVFPKTNKPELFTFMEQHPIYKKMHSGHHRRKYVIKEQSLATDNKKAYDSMINENKIGRKIDKKTARKGTKKITFTLDPDNNQKFISHMVMEKIPGITLLAFIENNNLTLAPPDQLLTLLINLMQALKKFHGTGYIHRDIKPENIMIDPNTYEVRKIFDYGLSLKQDEEATHGAGTVLFMSPEALYYPSETSVKSDVYSMGRVFRELCEDKTFGRLDKKDRKKQLRLEFDAATEGKPDITEKPTLHFQNRFLNTALTNVIIDMTKASQYTRSSVEASLAELIAIKKILPVMNKVEATYDAIVVSLGKKINAQQEFNKDSLLPLLDNPTLKLHEKLQMLQQIFKQIYTNRGGLYRNTSLVFAEPYTNTQLKHMRILKDAYLACLNTITKDTSVEDLKLLYAQINDDQNQQKYPNNINNFNMSSFHRFFNGETTTHQITHNWTKKIAAIIRIKTLPVQQEKPVKHRK